MELVKVDAICAQSPQRVLHSAPYVAGLRALMLVVQLTAELGGDHYAVPPALQRLAKEVLALPGTVAIRRIEEVDAGIQCRVHHARRRRSVDAPSEVVAAQSHHRNVERAEFALFHIPILSANHVPWNPAQKSLCHLSPEARRVSDFEISYPFA